jgi:hypothetical protein
LSILSFYHVYRCQEGKALAKESALELVSVWVSVLAQV